MKKLTSTLILFLMIIAVKAQYNNKVIIEPLLKTDTTTIGQPIVYPDIADAQVSNWLKKFFFYTEQKKLKRYEKILSHAQSIAAISPEDTRYFEKQYRSVFWLPPFHPCAQVSGNLGMGGFILYHADLSVSENMGAVMFLIKALSKLSFPLVIAGRNPSNRLQSNLMPYPHIIVVANPSQTEMDRLINEAHILALPTFQATGIKLKLIASLFQGRHCVVNRLMVQQTGLEELCHIADSPEAFAQCCQTLMEQPFTEKERLHRQALLEKNYTNFANGKRLLKQMGLSS